MVRLFAVLAAALLLAACQIAKADPDVLVLKNRVRATLHHGVICEVEPQEFEVFEHWGSQMYGSSRRNLSHDPEGGPLDGQPCGVRYNANDPTDTGVLLDARGAGYVGNENIFDMKSVGPKPVIELKPAN